MASQPIVLRYYNHDIGGNFATFYQREEVFSDESGDRELMFTRLQLDNRWMASGYVWKPWLSTLTLDGTIAIRQSIETFDENDYDSEILGEGLAEMVVYPGSRFPITASLSHQESRLDGSDAGDQSRTTRVSLGQTYRPFQSVDNYRWQVYHMLRDSDVSGGAEQSNLFLSSNHVRDEHSLESTLEYDTLDQEPDERGFNQASYEDLELFVRHDFHGAHNLTVQNVVNHLDLSDEFEGRSSGQQTTQFYNNTVWRPESDERLTINGSLRAQQITTEMQAPSDISRDFYFASIAANHRYTDSTQLFALISRQQRDQGESRIGEFLLEAGGVHRPAPIAIGKYSYSWTANGRMGNEESTDRGSVQSASSGIGHSIRRALGRRSIELGINQSVGVSADTDDENEGALTLVHGVSLSDSHANNSATTFWRASYDDVRRYSEFGLDDEEFQLVTLQFTRNSPLDINRYWSGNLTAQWQFDVDWQKDETTSLSYSADFSYINQRFRDVRNLTLTSSLFLTSDDLISEQGRRRFDIEDDSRFEQSRVEMRFDWRLRYIIGRLEASFLAAYTRIEQEQFAFLEIRLQRNF